MPIIGVDEVGRGSLAGPVVAVALRRVESDFGNDDLGVRDSKKLTEKQRVAIIRTLSLQQWIDHLVLNKNKNKNNDENNGHALENFSSSHFLHPQLPLQVALVHFDAPLIDEHNILYASLMAMAQAASTLYHPEDKILIDGPYDFHFLGRKKNITSYANLQNQQAVIRGEDHSWEIALASIIAKTYRDQWMRQLAFQYPQYGFDRHVGYATVKHRAAIGKWGIVPGLHRQSFLKKINIGII